MNNMWVVQENGGKMKYLRIKSGAYLAIVNEEMMIEINGAGSKEEAKMLAERRYGKGTVVCEIPSIIASLNFI